MSGSADDRPANDELLDTSAEDRLDSYSPGGMFPEPRTDSWPSEPARDAPDEAFPGALAAPALPCRSSAAVSRRRASRTGSSADSAASARAGSAVAARSGPERSAPAGPRAATALSGAALRLAAAARSGSAERSAPAGGSAFGAPAIGEPAVTGRSGASAGTPGARDPEAIRPARSTGIWRSTKVRSAGPGSRADAGSRANAGSRTFPGSRMLPGSRSRRSCDATGVADWRVFWLPAGADSESAQLPASQLSRPARPPRC